MASGPADIRELSFQNVIDTILKPAGVKVGGYPDDIFNDLTDDEKDKWCCNVCYLIVRDARECENRHLFCHTCVFAWTMTYGENSQKCPVCRNSQIEYRPVKEVDKLLEDKRIQCPETNCTFRAPLKIFLMHSHGRQRFVNDRDDLETLRPDRPPGTRLVVLSGLGTPADRVRGLRDQLSQVQGRMMLHQMMMLLQLEMQLRQQALVGFSQATDPNTRFQRLDEVLALNEQLNEVGTILGALLGTPMAAARAGRQNAAAGGAARSPAAAASPRGTSETPRIPPIVQSTLNRIQRSPNITVRFHGNNNNNDDDEEDSLSSLSSDSSDNSVLSRILPPATQRFSVLQPDGASTVTRDNLRTSSSSTEMQLPIRGRGSIAVTHSRPTEDSSDITMPNSTARQTHTGYSPRTRDADSILPNRISMDSNRNYRSNLASSAETQAISTAGLAQSASGDTTTMSNTRLLARGSTRIRSGVGNPQSSVSTTVQRLGESSTVQADTNPTTTSAAVAGSGGASASTATSAQGDGNTSLPPIGSLLNPNQRRPSTRRSSISNNSTSDAVTPSSDDPDYGEFTTSSVTPFSPGSVDRQRILREIAQEGHGLGARSSRNHVTSVGVGGARPRHGSSGIDIPSRLTGTTPQPTPTLSPGRQSYPEVPTSNGVESGVQSQADDNSTSGATQRTFAPQRRFRRDSVSNQGAGRRGSVSGATVTRARHAENSENASRVSRSLPRRTSNTNDTRPPVDGHNRPIVFNSRRTEQTRPPVARQRDSSTSGVGSSVSHASSSTTTSSTTRSLPATPGALIRARRRSEIRDDINSFTRHSGNNHQGNS